MSCACGPKWAPDGLVHMFLGVPKGEKCFFHASCEQHDLDYYNGIPRQEADAKFLVSMMKEAVEKNPTHKQILRANSFFRLVRYFGWISYYLVGRKHDSA